MKVMDNRIENTNNAIVYVKMSYKTGIGINVINTVVKII